MRKVHVVIQARMNSSRLPDKIMAPLAGQPMLAHVVGRLRAAERPRDFSWKVLVATSIAPDDDETERLCRRLDVDVVRGAEEDVLSRYLQAARQLEDSDIVVRATADNPLYCPRRARWIVEEHLAKESDYTCIDDLSYVVPEVMCAGALRKMAALARTPDCREHVTPYFRQDTSGFRTSKLPKNWRGLRPDIRLTVDTPSELARMCAIFDRLTIGDEPFPLEQVYELLDTAEVPV